LESKPTIDINSRSPEFNEFYLEEVWKKQTNKELICYEYLETSALGYITVNASKIFLKLDENNSITFPAILVGRLAANQKYTKLDIGRQLLLYVISLSKNISNQIGCRFVVLEVMFIVSESGDRVKNVNLVDWYISNGFEEALNQDRPNRTILYYDLKQ
jgi:hypothetical protein